MTANNPRKLLTLLALGLLAVAAVTNVAMVYRNRHRYPHELAPPPIPGRKELPATGTLTELSDFVTHLPIVVMELEQDPPPPTRWDSRKRYSVVVTDDPYVNGSLGLFRSETGANRLTDAPALQTKIKIRLRGVSSVEFPKKQYLIKTVHDDGSRKNVDVLGMGADWEWILNNPHIDKSLLRTYMCLNLAGRIMEYAPDTRYCEAFRKRGDEYEYLGVYLLIENINRGPNRLNVAKYNPRYAKAAYLLRRDRFQENGVILDTYATVERLARNHLEVKYPGRKKITAATVRYIEADVSAVEKKLYSMDNNEFVEYRDLLDAGSCADYFIINEFFANYDAQRNSFYLYKDVSGKLKFGPVWDFDQVLGNNAPYVLNPESTAMQNGVWYDRLLRDGKFLYQLANRYHQLRRWILSEQYLYRFMDDVTAYLGDAVARDWNRWRYDNPHSLTYAAGDVLHENALMTRASHKEELDAMKKVIHEHGVWLDGNIDTVFGHFVDLIN